MAMNPYRSPEHQEGEHQEGKRSSAWRNVDVVVCLAVVLFPLVTMMVMLWLLLGPTKPPATTPQMRINPPSANEVGR